MHDMDSDELLETLFLGCCDLLSKSATLATGQNPVFLYCASCEAFRNAARIVHPGHSKETQDGPFIATPVCLWHAT